MPGCATSFSTARSSIRSPKPGSSWKAGADITTPCALTYRLAISRPPGKSSSPRLLLGRPCNPDQRRRPRWHRDHQCTNIYAGLVCGGRSRASDDKELSPRGWGNRHGADPLRRGGGSIPTRVGEPLRHRVSPSKGEVYPHAGGGTRSGETPQRAFAGLSPRGWGNLDDGPFGASVVGSIPTRVGEPCATGWTASSSRVYPHAGGGTP